MFNSTKSCVVVALCLTACGTPSAGPRPITATPPPLSLAGSLSPSGPSLDALPSVKEEPADAGFSALLGWAAGHPISVADLLGEWNATDPNSLRLVLEKIVTARLARAEAQRMSLALAPEAAALRLEQEVSHLEQALREEGMGLASYAREEYGQSSTQFLGTLRLAVKRQMLIERVTRAWVFSNPWLRLRMIVVEGPELMLEVRKRLEAGEDFASLAKEFSQDGSSERGGLVPFLVREEDSPLSRRAFSQEVGSLGTPFLHKGLQVLVRVEQRHPANPRPDWANLEAEVEASLLEFPLTDTEFGHWKASMEQRYPIDVEPLMELLGVESSG